MLQYENYEKTEWANANRITDVLLNKIENGIENLDNYITSADGVVDTFTDDIQEINDKIGYTFIGENISISSAIATLQESTSFNRNKIEDIEGIISSMQINDTTIFSEIDDIQETISSIHGLPTVTSSDNGKFLRVSSGTWAVTSIPSASGVGF